MFWVAICDKDRSYQRMLSELMMKALFDTVEVAFHYYDTGMQIINAAVENRLTDDLLLIDIQLPETNGLRTVQFLRRIGIRSDVIFVTEAIEYGIECYRYGTYDFIRKPVAVTEFERVMRRYVKEKIEKNADFYQITSRGGIVKINLRRVLYFESRGRKVNAVEQDMETSFYQKLDMVESQLKNRDFVRIHQSYLINRAYITFISGTEVVLANRIRLPVSKRYAVEVREMYRRWRIC